ncbi:MAG: histidinol-phosphatase HisJ family protein [Oscillospiraceae bacterium]|jgi:histidinol-phosphatase (PHP family)|nr:histidinol-phosphatase HisJ family protein [Oscillospiraceae bacterium]
MVLTDYHIHSICSNDGHHSMLEMARASHEKGVTTLCFTDHCDLDDYLTGKPDPNCFSNRDRMLDMYAGTLPEKPEGLSLFLGLELGEGNHDPARAREIAATPELDFVLGSLHSLKGLADFYEHAYRSEAECLKLVGAYLDELIELSRLEFFDVMAHIGYTVRYMRKAGFNADVSAEKYPEKMRELLTNLITRGKGIELNCSGFADPLIGAPIPMADVLRLYRQLGGEIITVGSDAHRTHQAGRGLADGLALLRQLGYGYITVFEKRKPRFIKI